MTRVSRELQDVRRCGAVVFDIDDTLVDGCERQVHGFKEMVDLARYVQGHPRLRLHVVTARPRDSRAHILKLFAKNMGITLEPGNLWTLSTEHYDDPDAARRDTLVAQRGGHTSASRSASGSGAGA